MPTPFQYKVKPNESLLQIAQNNNLTYQDLIQANPGTNRVSTGQTINLPPPPTPNTFGVTGASSGSNRTPPFMQVYQYGQNVAKNLGLLPTRTGAAGGSYFDRNLAPAMEFAANRPILGMYGPTIQQGADVVGGTVSGLAGGSGQNLYQPSTTARAELTPTGPRKELLSQYISDKKSPPLVFANEAAAIGLDAQSMIRAGYQWNPREQVYEFTGDNSATSSGGGELQGQGRKVQEYMAAGKRGKAHKAQLTENWQNREALSWTDASRKKAARERRRQYKRYLEYAKQQEQSLSDVGSFGLVSWNQRAATG